MSLPGPISKDKPSPAELLEQLRIWRQLEIRHERTYHKTRFRDELNAFHVILSKLDCVRMKMSIEKIKKTRILIHERITE